MITIYKYPLLVDDNQIINLHAKYEILTVQVQGNVPCIWAKVDTENEMISVNIKIIGTGHMIDEKLSLKYIGTFQLYNGSLVFHVFENLEII